MERPMSLGPDTEFIEVRPVPKNDLPRFGDWQAVGVLGRGGMGTVYDCVHTSGQRAAVKAFDEAWMEVPALHARFCREAKIMAALKHPAVVQIRAMDLVARPPYLVMDRIDGGSMEHQLRVQGGQPAAAVRKLTKCLLDALRYLHEHGVHHRDLKPANILLQDGALVLIDFGLAASANQTLLTRVGERFGTMNYAPPEWFGDDVVDPVRWDLYSAGVVLFEVATGHFAFRPKHPPKSTAYQAEVMALKRRYSCLDPGEVCDPHLRALIRDLTARDPNRRPRTAAEALSQLKPKSWSRKLMSAFRVR